MIRKKKKIDKAVKRSCRKERREWIESKGKEAQEAASQNDSKMLYKIVHDLTGTTANTTTEIKDKDGKALLLDEEKDGR